MAKTGKNRDGYPTKTHCKTHFVDIRQTPKAVAVHQRTAATTLHQRHGSNGTLQQRHGSNGRTAKASAAGSMRVTSASGKAQ
jgi:hypothetical protein